MKNTPAANPSLVNRIRIEGLFDLYSYDLHPKPTKSLEHRLFLLYGENGAGKSTILQLIFHLLNPEPYGGHRTFVSQVPFLKVSIELSSGLLLTAEKVRPFEQNSYTLTLTGGALEAPVVWEWKRDKAGRGLKDEEDYKAYCDTLSEAGLSFHFLSDSRKVVGLDQERRRMLLRQRELFMSSQDVRMLIQAADGGHPGTESLVQDAVDRTLKWFQQQALTGTTAGYTSVNTIYTDLIRRIIESGEPTESEESGSVSDLRERLGALAERNSRFSSYGLTSELDVANIDALLAKAAPDKVSILNTVLQPFLDGHNARLDALQGVQKVIDNFVSMLTDFFARKSVVLDVRRELEILTPKDQRLSPEGLSSGERQLLLLLCNAVTARKDGTILIIDEPEISLNVKWQRKLVEALVTCLEGVESQIILATHSIEILAKYDNYVCPLTDPSEPVA